MADLFGIDNYRKALISQAADYIWIARDQALMLRGMYVTVLIPKEENNIDEYSDYKDTKTDYVQIQTYIEPQFDKYILTLSLLGQDMEREIKKRWKTISLAERVGFEPTVLANHQFSRLAP